MVSQKKRGNEEDIAEVVRRKLEAHRKQPPGAVRGSGQNIEKRKLAGSSYVPSLNASNSSEFFRETPRRQKEVLRVSNKDYIKKAPKPAPKKQVRKIKSKSPLKPIAREEEVIYTEKSKTPLIIVSLLLILVFFGILLAAFFLFYHVAPLKSGERALSVNDLISYAKIRDEKIANVRLVDSLDLEGISIVRIIFIAADNTQYSYYPGHADREYTFNTSDIGLESFEGISSAVALVEYKSAPPLNSRNIFTNITNNTINRTNQSSSPSNWKGDSCVDSCSSLGFNCGTHSICGSAANCGTCGSGQECKSGKCVGLCENECSGEGLFCDNNRPYNCSIGSAGCFIRTNLTACSSGKQCFNGFCKDIPDCTLNSDCSSFNDKCSVGICNSSGKCEIVYNLSSNICRADSGECDVAESCTGVSEKCPSDVFEPDRTSCALGVCSSGQCVECLIDDDCSSDGCYSGELRNYYCENKQCKYNAINVDETLANGNCEDGIDNDCDSKIDNLDEGCACTLKTCSELGYQCGVWDNGCFGTVDCGTCTGKDCLNGQCVECISDSNCSADNCYSGEYRDYYCNSSNSCSYNVVTQAEKLENGNCNDGKDNDCDGKTDGEDMLCKEFYGPTDYVAYWKFENNVNDETGNYNGTLGGNAAYVAGKKGQGLTLDGNDDYMNTSYGYTLSAFDPCTYSLWVKHSATGGDPTPIFLSQSATSGLGSRMYLVIDSGKWAMGIGTSSSATRSTIPADNNWHMITVTMGNPSTLTKIAKMYVDGVDIGYTKGYTSYAFNSYLRFGVYSSTLEYDFAGDIDEAMVYQRVLSDTEIQQIYCSQGGEAAFCSGLSSSKPSLSFWEWIKSIFD